jgi:flagellar protein FlbT
VTGLILNLRPWETFLVGDLVLQNGGRRAQLRVRDDNAGVLRLSDALHPNQVVSPLTRAYYAAQLLLLGKEECGASLSLLLGLLQELEEALGDTHTIADALRHASDRRFHKVLRTLRPLLPEEALLLSRRQLQEESGTCVG